MTLAQERELLQRIQLDRREFGVLFDEYYRAIFGYLYRRTGQYELSKDMAAETFLKAFISIEKFVWRDVPFSAWLYRIASNEANQFFRKNRYQPLHLDSILNTTGMLQYDDEAERLELEREWQGMADFKQIAQHLKTMNIRYQEVIALRYFEGKENGEISTILNKPEGTVKSLLSRGLNQLRVLCNQKAN